MDQIREAIVKVVTTDRPMTVRQVFYRLVSLGVVDKTEAEYKRTVGRLLTEMRRDRTIPYGWIADNTRWMRKPTTYRSMESALAAMQDYYRRDLWADQEDYVEVWLEKDALASHPGQFCYLYYFGDHDPSGVDIPRNVEKQLRELIDDLDLEDPPYIEFAIVAVTEDQITDLSLPTRPTKTTDVRSRNFQGDSVEVDAIPPAGLRKLVEDCITQHIDPDRFERALAVETVELETVAKIIQNLPGSAA